MPVEGEDVVLGDRAPVDIARRADLGPALDAGEQPLDARPVAADAVAVEFVFVNDQAADGSRTQNPSRPAGTRMAGDPGSVRVLPEHRHQVFGAGEDEDVRLLGVEVLRQALVGLARDRRAAKGSSRSRTGRCRRRSRRTARAAGRSPSGPGWWRSARVIEPVPVTGLAANFSPMPRMAPPPLGKLIAGAEVEKGC